MEFVTYHYVRPETDAPPDGYYHLPLDQFEAQLDYFAETRTLLSRDEFEACLRGEREPPADGIVLTFDDALADHYRWVLPELERRGLWGVFFVATDPLVHGRRLAVHRVHTLVSEYPGSELLSATLDVVRDHEALSVPAADDEGMYAGRDTDDDVRAVKQLLNQAVPYGHLPAVLDALESRFPAAGAVEAADLYLSVDQLSELAAAGMVMGAHSVSHPLLSRLPAAEQRREIRDSQEHLATRVDAPVDLFAYPYGGEASYTDRTRELVREAGFEWAVTTQPGEIAGADLGERPLALPRRDCTAFPHGESAVSLPDG